MLPAGAEAGEREAKRARITEQPPDDWRAVFAASAVVPVSAEGVRAFTEPAVFSRSQEQLAAADDTLSGRRRQLAVSIQRETVMAAAGHVHGHAYACERALRLAVRFGGGANAAEDADDDKVVLVHASLRVRALPRPYALSPRAAAARRAARGMRPIAISICPQPLPQQESESGGCYVCTAVTCTGEACRETLGLCPHAAACLLRLAAAPDLPAHDDQGAPESAQPLYYSHTCGHQLFPGNKIADGGDPSCFKALPSRMSEFAQQLRAAGHLMPAAGVLLQLAASLAVFKGDPTLLWRYDVDGTSQEERESDMRRRQLAHVCGEHVEESLSDLCLIAIDERLGVQQRNALTAAALNIADSFELQESKDLGKDPDPPLADAHHIWNTPMTDKIKDIVLRQTRRALIRAARLARTPWNHPLLEAALAGHSTPSSLELLSVERLLDLRMRCRYLLERGRSRECLNLSRAGGVASTLAAALQELTGRPEDAVAGVIELVDAHLPRLFDASAALFKEKCGWACKCQAADRDPGQAVASLQVDHDHVHHHALSCTRERCMWLLHNPYMHDNQQQRRFVLQISIIEIGKTIESLRHKLSAAGDHLSALWLSLALLPLDFVCRMAHRFKCSHVKQADVIQSVVRSGLALRSALSSPLSSVEHESAEALRAAQLPLAEAFVASVKQPEIALEAALLCLGRMGFLPRTEADWRSGAPLPSRWWCAPLQDAGISSLAARFYLRMQGSALDRVWSEFGDYVDSDAEPNNCYLSRIGDAIFGPVSEDGGAMIMTSTSPDGVAAVAASLLAARRGTALSALGECKPASAQQYETLLLACALRLDTLKRFDDALRLAAAVLELESSGAGADARRAFCFDLLITAKPFGSTFRASNPAAGSQIAKSFESRSALASVVSVDALRTFFGSGFEAGDRALRDAPCLVLLELAARLLQTHLADYGGSALCADGRALTIGGVSQQLSGAIQSLLAIASVGQDGSSSSVSAFLAGVVLRLAAKAGRSVTTFCSDTGECEQRLRFAVLLNAGGDVASAAPLVFSSMTSPDSTHSEFALRFLDDAAPRLAELWGAGIRPVGVHVDYAHAVLQRRRHLFGLLLERIHGGLSQFDEMYDPFGPYKSLAEKFAVDDAEDSDDDPLVVDLFLAAKIGLAAFSCPQVQQYFSRRFDLASPAFWRVLLGELHVRLLSQASDAGEGERADAMRLAMLVWDVCPCVQAVWVIRDVLSTGGEQEKRLCDTWLQERLAEIKRSVPLVYVGEWKLPTRWTRTCSTLLLNRENPVVSEESKRDARLVLAAVALLLAEDEAGRARVEAALGLDARARPESSVAAMALLARWGELSDHAVLSDDDTNGRMRVVTHWRGVAEMTKPLEHLLDYASKAAAIPYTYQDPGRVGPLASRAGALEDLYSVEQLDALSGPIVEHQRMRKNLRSYRDHPCCSSSSSSSCQICKREWRCRNRRFYSLGIFGDPVVRLAVDALLRFPWEERRCGAAAHKLAATYAVEKAKAIARAVRSGAPSHSERAALLQSAQKVYIAARTFTEELEISYSLENLGDLSFEGSVTSSFRNLEVFSSFLPTSTAASA
eukprot:tig00000949_g5715.t1